MQRIAFPFGWLLALLLATNLWAEEPQATHPATSTTAELPRVFLIGDSISLGYTGPVTKLLEGKAVVTRPGTNCQHSGYGLANLEKWLGGKHYDVIHFNWGIWDTHFIAKKNGALIPTSAQFDPETMKVRFSPEEYAENLRALIKILKASGDKLVWASTTPVWKEGTLRHDLVPQYNEVAKKIMEEEGIPIDDLYALVVPRRKEWQGADTVHFGPQGNAAMAEQVSASILKALQPAEKP